MVTGYLLDSQSTSLTMIFCYPNLGGIEDQKLLWFSLELFGLGNKRFTNITQILPLDDSVPPRSSLSE